MAYVSFETREWPFSRSHIVSDEQTNTLLRSIQQGNKREHISNRQMKSALYVGNKQTRGLRF